MVFGVFWIAGVLSWLDFEDFRRILVVLVAEVNHLVAAEVGVVNGRGGTDEVMIVRRLL